MPSNLWGNIFIDFPCIKNIKFSIAANSSFEAWVAAKKKIENKKVLLNEQYPEFILTHVVRPYQGMLGREKTITHLRYVPFGDNETGLNYFELQNYAWEAKYEENLLTKYSYFCNAIMQKTKI